MYDFDKIIDRRGTHSLKYDFAVKKGLPEGILPLWVADMDFASPACVLDALSERVGHGVFGYSDAADEGYFNALSNWYKKRINWEIKPEWLVKTPGVVFAICAAIRALTKAGDAILIQQPVYYPFESAIKNNDRRLVVNQLIYSEGHYSINLDEMEKQIINEKVKMFILCSPHNPVGRVWSKEELTAVGNLCIKHGVIVVADEIHADFIYPGYKHQVFAEISHEFSQNCIVCTAPTKTFNLAGLQISNIFIPNEKMRKAFKLELARTGYSQPNVMGLIACQAAYEQGEEWLEELIKYLTGNLSLLRTFLTDKLPQVKLVEPEGTYLVWMDFSATELSDLELDKIFVHKAKLWLDGGTMFGKGGEGFQRMNIACPKSLLNQALERIEKVFVK